MTAPKSYLDVNAIFDHDQRRPGPEGQQRVALIRHYAKVLAEAIRDEVPNCNDKLTALEHVRQAVFFAQEGIELNAEDQT